MACPAKLAVGEVLLAASRPQQIWPVTRIDNICNSAITGKAYISLENDLDGTWIRQS